MFGDKVKDGMGDLLTPPCRTFFDGLGPKFLGYFGRSNLGFPSGPEGASGVLKRLEIINQSSHIETASDRDEIFTYGLT